MLNLAESVELTRPTRMADDGGADGSLVKLFGH